MNEVQQWEQFQDMLQGKQNFCIIEDRKAPVLYSLLIESHPKDFPDVEFNEYWNYDDNTAEIVVGRPGFFKLYTELLESRPEYTRHGFQIAMGTLLGYDIESCIEFAADPVDCSCSKCGGKQTPSDYNDLLTWVQSGCQHILRDKICCGERQQDSKGKWFQAMRLHGKPYGRLYEMDEEAVLGNPALQPWSIPA